MGVVVTLIILSVGVFAFFTVVQSIQPPDDETVKSIQNVNVTASSIFDILGIVLIIGAIMAVLGLVYSYISPSSPNSKPTKIKKVDEKKEQKKEERYEVKKQEVVDDAFLEWKKNHQDIYDRQ